MLHDMQQPSMSDTPDDWMTAREVADLFGVHRNTVREWANSGLIPSHPLPSGRLRYKRTEVDTARAILASEPRAARNAKESA